ncbi:hypothetical protein G3N93_41315, partial [Burkholderia sp. Se-20378]|nr:hypothetical protein [Burkholderia sp. Se-20378]
MNMKTSRARRVPGSVLAAVAAGALLLLAGCEKSGAPVTQPDTAARAYPHAANTPPKAPAQEATPATPHLTAPNAPPPPPAPAHPRVC